MSESLPFERTSARLTAPDWYDFHYFRRLSRIVTPLWLIGVLLISFGIFVVFTCLYVVIATAVANNAPLGLVLFVGFLELFIVTVAFWAFARDYEQRRKERRLTPYGRKLYTWIESDFIPWLQENLAIYIENEDAEHLIVKKSFTHFSFRGTSNVVLSYDDRDIVIKRSIPANERSFLEDITVDA